MPDGLINPTGAQVLRDGAEREAPSRGLDREEAARRLLQWGYNEVRPPSVHPLRQLAVKFWGPVPWMLEVTIGVTLAVGHLLDAAIMALLLGFNAAVSFWQEDRAHRALELLQQHLRVTARVLREGAWATLPAREIVPGDIVHLRMGDIVPADVRIEAGDILVDESPLTGEALPQDHGPGTVAYAGGIIQRGEATGTVTATGPHTFFGRTTELVHHAHSRSHLEDTILGIVRYLVVVDAVLVALLLVDTLYRGLSWLSVLPFALMVLVASVPVALPPTFTLAEAIGAQELARRGILVTRLQAVEEAAGMDVLCADKTGTLTENRLRVRAVRPLGPYTEGQVLQWAAAASSPATQDALDLAVFAALPADLPRLRVTASVPFDPEFKRASATVDLDGRAVDVTKGAPAVVAALCPPGDGARLLAEEARLARAGYRVLAVAAGPPGTFRPVGLLAFEDPPRPDSAEAVAALAALGVRTKMVTGDAPETALAVAARVGLGGRLWAGGRPEGPGTAAYDVFAGVLPEDKFALVRALQEAGHVVGMTGDGTNDAPALKQAEVGIAVENATDVAKASASLVLTTPGLGGIRQAVEVSRRVSQRMHTYTLNKIVKTVQIALFLTGGFFATGHFLASPRLVVLLLFANDFVTMALATDRVRPAAGPTRWKVPALAAAATAMGVLLLGEAFAVLAVARSVLGLAWPAVRTVVFLMLVFSGQATVYVVREPDHWWRSRPSGPLLAASFAGLLAVTAMARFGLLMAPVGWAAVGWVLGFAMAFGLLLDSLKIILGRQLGPT